MKEAGEGARVVVFAHEKGGQGKTTTVAAFGYGLARRGYRVLCVDYDAQASLSAILGARGGEGGDVYEWVFEGADVRRAHGAIDVVPASLDGVRSIEHDMEGDPMAAVYALRDAVGRVSREYDFVLVDTASAVGTALISALSAADYVVIPAEATVYGVEGLRSIHAAVERVRRGNPGLRVAGVFVNKYRERVNDQRDKRAAIERACAELGFPVFRTTVRDSANISAASADHADYRLHRTRPPAALEFEWLVDEFLEAVS